MHLHDTEQHLEERPWSRATVKCAIAQSGLFDADFYMSQTCVVKGRWDPIDHYLQIGAWSLLSPGPEFDSAAYINSYPDILESGLDPLSHYLLLGINEDKSIFPYGHAGEPALFYKGRNSSNHPKVGGHAVIYAACYGQTKVDDSLIHTMEELGKVASSIFFVSSSYIAPTELLKIRYLLSGYAIGKPGGWLKSYEQGIIHASRAGLLGKADALILHNDLAIAPVLSYKTIMAEVTRLALEKDLAPNMPLLADCDDMSAPHVPAFCLVPKKLFPHAPVAAWLKEILGSPDLPVFTQDEAGSPFFVPNPAIQGKMLAECLPTDPEQEDMAELLNAPNMWARQLEEIHAKDSALSNLLAKGGGFRAAATGLPGISIILPLFNMHETGIKIIQTLLSQSYEAMEIIIIDDASAQICEAELRLHFSKEFESGRIIYLRNSWRQGPGATRLLGIRAARYPWILHLSSTVSLPPGCLLRLGIQLAALDRGKCVYLDTVATVAPASGGSPASIAGLVHPTEDACEIALEKDGSPWLQERHLYQAILNICDSLEKMSGLYLRPCLPDIYINPNLAAPAAWLDKSEAQLLISIVIPASDDGTWLAEAIESALMQIGAFQREIIIACDASSSVTLEVANAYAESFPEIRVLPSRQPEGFSATVRRGIEAAAGDLTCLLRAADYWSDPGKLLAQLTFLANAENCHFCFCGYHYLDQKMLDLHEPDFLAELPQLPQLTDLAKHEWLAPAFSTVMCDTAILKNMPVFLDEWMFSTFLAAAYFANFGAIGFVPHAHAVIRLLEEDPYASQKESTRLAAAICHQRLARMIAPLPAREGLNKSLKTFTERFFFTEASQDHDNWVV